MNKRILIMSASVGSGHTQSAKALAEEFRRRPETAVVIDDDALEHTNPLYKQIYSDLYKTLSANAPKFLGWLYESTDDPWRNDQMRLMLDLPNTIPLVKYIQEVKPDAIVCTHFMPAGVVSHLIAKKKIKARLYNVVTDFHFHAEWITRAFHHYFVAQEEDRERMSALGLPKTRVSVTGIPIQMRFAEKVDRREVCKTHGLDPDKPLILLSAGALGFGSAESVLKRLLAMPQDFQTLVLCGRNEKLRKAVEALAKKSKKKTLVMGYTTAMPSLMKTAHLLMSKPGGLTTAEALACGLPMAILDPVGGQEERNAEMLLENGAAIKCNDPTVLAYKLGTLLDNPQRLAQMSKNAAAISHPDAAKKIVDFVIADSLAPRIITQEQEKILRRKVQKR